jgi:hypothetical protein
MFFRYAILRLASDSCDIRIHFVDLVAAGHYGFMKQLHFFRIIQKKPLILKTNKVSSF